MILYRLTTQQGPQKSILLVLFLERRPPTLAESDELDGDGCRSPTAPPPAVVGEEEEEEEKEEVVM